MKQLLLVSFLMTGWIFSANSQTVDFSASVVTGCAPLKVKFTFPHSDTITSFAWDFGNGETDYIENPDTIVYSEPGVYTPTLVFNGRIDQAITKVGYIVVHEPVSAAFNVNPNPDSYYLYTFEHTGTLEDTIDYDFTWDFGEGSTRTGSYQEFIFPDTGIYQVTLTVTNELGCSAILTRDVVVLQELIIPNVFTPGGDDEINNAFIIQNSAGVPLRLCIFTRTGILVFKGEGTVIQWYGKTASGEDLKTGVYFYTLEALNADPDKIFSKSGFIHLYRKE